MWKLFKILVQTYNCGSSIVLKKSTKYKKHTKKWHIWNWIPNFIFIEFKLLFYNLYLERKYISTF